MFDLGIQELIVIFVVALLVFGPKRLPELGRTIGKGVRELKRALFEIKADVGGEFYGLDRIDRPSDARTPEEAGPDKGADKETKETAGEKKIDGEPGG
ncbi:MAG: twin-arginine translocase TatA/TatE family subunit [Thermodesulfovibrionales bacterium]|nr:twin-arginine translocase TatA/TatE family subunit [Thermodesulfovibrionales bacterium]